jgi:F0F1-type ATP synthase delta subunit
MKERTNDVVKKIVRTCIIAIPESLHLAILKEFHGFSGILNFSQTIKDLIVIDQMQVFGISNEMQIILRHINQLRMLGSMNAITKAFQKEYEEKHKRTVVVVSLAKEQEISFDEVTQFLNKKVPQPADIIFKTQNTVGISVHFESSVLEYTPDSIIKTLKVA